MRAGTSTRMRLRQKMNRKVVIGLISSLFLFSVFFIYSNFFNSENAYAAVNYTWNGSVDSSWSNGQNWTPNGIPGAVDNITIGIVATRNPILLDTVTVNNITINNGGIFTLNGFNFTALGTTTINNGATVDVSNSLFLCKANAVFNGGTFIDIGTAGTLVTEGTTTTAGLGVNGPTFNSNVKINSATIRLTNCTFNKIVILNKTGTSNDQSAGNNTFNDELYLTNNSTGYFMMSSSVKDIYNSSITLSSLGTGIIYIAYNGTGTKFNGDVIVNSTSTGGVRIGASSGTSDLAVQKSVRIGSEGFNGGMLMLSRVNFHGTDTFRLSVPSTAILTLGPASTFGGDVIVESGGICLSGATISGAATITKTGTSNDRGAGSNVFSGTVSISNMSTGYLLMSNSTGDIYNSDVTFTASSTGIIYPSYNGSGNIFSGNILVNSLGTGGVRIGANTGTSTLANTKRIIVGDEGFAVGTLTVGNFAFDDTSSQSLSLSGNAIVTVGPNTTFAGDVNMEAGGICLNGATFNGAANFIKNGTSNDQGSGNNVFNRPVSFTNNGTGYLLMSASKNDIYNSEVTFTCTNSGILYPAYRGIVSQFNDNIILNSTGSGGVRIGANTGSSELAIGKKILIGTEGFSAGMLTLGNFTSADTSGHSIELTGSSVVTLGPNSYFAGDFYAEAGGFCLSGTTFDGRATFVKNGSTSDQGTGNNIFNKATTFTNNGTGYILLSNTTSDIYNAEVTYSSLGSGLIYSAYRGVATQFNDNIIVNSTGTGGVRIGASTGTSVQANNKTILVGAEGFTSGMLMLANFTSTNTNAQSITLSGNGVLTVGPQTTFASDIIATCGGICLSGATFNGTAVLTKTGSTSDQGTGNNLFSSTTSITNNGTGYLLMSSSKPDIFNDDLNLTITNSGIIYSAYTGLGNEFNGNVVVTSTGSGSIRFGSNVGTSKLADGKTISIGSNGFTGGYLQLNRFEQIGNTPQSMDVTVGTGAIYMNTGTVFNADVNIKFPQVYLNGATYQKNAYFEKNGATNNAGTGGNTFNGPTTVKNSGAGIFYLANTSGDDFNDQANFLQTGTGSLRPAYNATSTFAKDISTLGSTGVITFGASNGTVLLDGGSLQNIEGNSLFAPIMRRLTVNNASGGLRLNVPVTINAALTLINGMVYTTNTNLLIIDNGMTTVNSVSDASYVSGPVRKIGTQAFTFPVGKNGRYRPISMSAPTGATSHFTAEYFSADPGVLYNILSLVPTIKQISRCEYWNLQRTNGISNVSVALSWNSQTCAVGTPTDLKVTGWNSLLSIWNDLGNGTVTGTSAAGSITSLSSVSGFGIFTISSSNVNVALPVELTSFDANLVEDKTLVEWQTASEINNDYFTVERSPDGQYFEPIGTVGGSGNTTNLSRYSFTDENPLAGTSYYRLRQTDYDGKFEIFDPVSVEFKGRDMDFIVKSIGPNPFNNVLRVDYFSPDNSDLILVLSSLDGSIAFSDRLSVYQGTGSYSTGQLPNLSSGVYILKMMKGDAVLDTRKLVRN